MKKALLLALTMVGMGISSVENADAKPPKTNFDKQLKALNKKI